MARLSVARDVASAVAYLHSCDRIHRDIKTSNVFIDHITGHAVLADFGLVTRVPGGKYARREETGLIDRENSFVGNSFAGSELSESSRSPTPALTRPRFSPSQSLSSSSDGGMEKNDVPAPRVAKYAGTMTSETGTYYYMAPEVFHHHGKYGTACDIWSFGVLLAELLNEKMPYAGLWLDPVQVVEACAKGNLRPTVDNKSNKFPQDLIDLVGDCTQMDPHERPSASEVLVRIEEALTLELKKDRKRAKKPQGWVGHGGDWVRFLWETMAGE